MRFHDCECVSWPCWFSWLGVSWPAKALWWRREGVERWLFGIVGEVHVKEPGRKGLYISWEGGDARSDQVVLSLPVGSLLMRRLHFGGNDIRFF